MLDSLRRFLLLLLLCSAVFAFSAEPQFLTNITKSTALDNGMDISSGKAAVRITALRDDIVRVRISPDGKFAPDHSWAVLPDMRNSAAKVVPLADGGRPGFRTSQLRVEVDRDPFRIIISDKNGRILSEDYAGRPTTFYGEQFKVYKNSPEDERYYGLGDKPGPMDRRNRAFQLWNTDAFGYEEATDPVYKSIPFFIAQRADVAYGIFLDNTWRTTFDFDTEIRDAYSFGAEGGDLDYYFIYGPEVKQVVSHFTDLVGRTPLPPLWALGFHQSRYSYETEARVREIAKTFREKQIPLDAIHLDIGYQDRNRPFTVDRKVFPRFEQMLRDLAEQNIHAVAITDLHIPRLPNANYVPYDTGASGDHFVKAANGSPYVGPVWPGPSVFPDFSRKSTQEWWGSLYRDFYLKDGISGFWNDMNEPAIFEVASKTMPLDNQHRIDVPDLPQRIASHREIHNVYGMLNTKGTFEGLLKLNPDQRPYVLTRASYAGGWRYAATWTGDNTSSWNHLRLSTMQLMSLGISGYTLVGDDIGGFAGTPTADMLTRWIQLGAFNPIYRDHTAIGTGDQEPWVHGPRHEAIRRRYIETRYRLMPYLYTTVEQSTHTGLPVMRPLFVEYAQKDLKGFEREALDSQFLFGRDLMVAPQRLENLDKYEVRFPAGNWYDFWTGRSVKMSAPVVIEPQLELLPVFARGGSIIPMQPLTQSTDEQPRGALKLLVFPGSNCEGSLYQDDGKTFAYKQGAFLRQSYTCSVLPDGLEVSLGKAEGTYQPWWSQLELVVHGAARPAKEVLVNGKPVTNAAFDSERGATTLVLPALPQGGEIKILY